MQEDSIIGDMVLVGIMIFVLVILPIIRNKK